MPGWLQAFARNQPVSDGFDDTLDGKPAAGDSASTTSSALPGHHR
jgi:hypothetical protein